jgi:hypothetical protein
MRSVLFPAAAVALALSACQPSDGSDSGAETARTEGAAAPTAAPPAPAPSPDDSGGRAAESIPRALRGAWGMVPGDCTSTRGDAKGLLRVSATTLTLYESVGRLGAVKDRSENTLRADYAFTGEGMEWMRDITLTASNGGNTLTRLDRGGEEPGGPFTYTRCAP